MNGSQDVRWRQPFSSYQTTLRQLGEAVDLRRHRPLTNLEKQGTIQSFEYTYELAWNTLNDCLVFQGIAGLVGARDTIREAFRRELISEGNAWMEMLADRNLTTHTYNESTAEAVVRKICERYYNLLVRLREKLSAI